jgi:predicted transcriptional regulator
MATVHLTGYDSPPVIETPEGAEILKAIDKGILDAETGRTVPSEEVRKMLPQWISASSTRKLG